MLGKSFFRFWGWGLLLVLLGMGVLWGIHYYQVKHDPQYQAEQYFNDLQKQYENDTYGGDTPEETLHLFIDALKKGDLDLAAKYFLIDEQEKWRNYLDKVKNAGNLEGMIKDAERLKSNKNNGEEAFFNVVDEKNVVQIEVIFGKQKNKRWKILEL